jgi:hypothetical protein
LRLTLLLIPLALACFAPLQSAQGVTPPADGCYPAFTTAEGCNALQALGSGQGNTAIGWYSLFIAGAANFNTGVGAGTLALNGGDSNTAVGAAALLLNTTGMENTATGTDALVHNDSGGFNTAIGAFAMFNNIDGGVNIAVGRHALFANIDGNSNTAIGVSALEDNVSGFQNAAVGGAALESNIDGQNNIAVGQAALSNNTSGSNNIGIGFFGGLAVTDSDNVICIGTQGLNMSNSCFIGQIFGATATGGSAVFIDANNKLGTVTSSKRFKEEIRPMNESSEALFKLKPITFRYKEEIDPSHISQFGLVAEDVERVNPDLVVRDKEGKPYSVRYDQVNAMLLNEFLKEHRTVKGQQKEIDALKAELKEQRALIQQVNDKMKLNRPAPQMVANDR